LLDHPSSRITGAGVVFLEDGMPIK
jgi:hypothetical protein